MTPNERFQLLIAVMSLLFLIVSTALGLLVRVIIKFTRVEDRVGAIMEDICKLVEDKDKVHTALYNQMSEDRKASNERLIWLERSAWPKRAS